MLSQNRFDAIIVASGSGNIYDVFHLIQDAYVSPIVKVAGAAAGTKELPRQCVGPYRGIEHLGKPTGK